MNSFIEYLNSTNNAGSDSSGSLAEKQFKSSFYDEIKVNRKIGSYISRCISEGKPEAFIITGHAGDGKTSILVQVLKDSGLLDERAELLAEDELDKLYYIKDMSEISPLRQAEVLETALLAPQKGKCSILISNTGPLIAAFNQLVKRNHEESHTEYSEKDKLLLQSKLLEQMDTNSEEPITIDQYRFHLLNIARADNVIFAKKILKNIVADHLWSACDTCSCKGTCPILHNKCLISSHFDRVGGFIENYYRFLMENDKRLTIRQMVGQISFAITGNLTCAKVPNLKSPFFRYNIANLFFGYVGQTESRDADQIKGIKQIKMLGLDKIALDSDYDLFVNNNLDCFTADLHADIKEFIEKNRSMLRKSPDEDDGAELLKRDLNARRAIRRFYLLFGNTLGNSDHTYASIYNQVFGTYFSDYKKLISGIQSQITLKNMKDVVFKALYVKNTGFLPTTEDRLPLTLRRQDDVYQSAMLVLGRVEKRSLSVKQKKRNNKFDDMEEHYDLVLEIGHDEYKLSLPLLTYFDLLNRGAVASNNNPALTHGIARLDALLLSAYRSSDEDNELMVLINTISGQQPMTLTFEDKSMRVD